MHFEGEFRVPGQAKDVIKRFEDVPRMARCMPGAVLETQAEDGSWPGAMVVTFGPKKINFKGKATCEFDEQALTGSVHGRGAADMRAARIGVKVSFALSDAPDSAAAETIVKIVSDAELGGVLEDFARTGGIAVANAIMADFARRAADEFAKDAPAADRVARTVSQAEQGGAAIDPVSKRTDVATGTAVEQTSVSTGPGPEPPAASTPRRETAASEPPAAPLAGSTLLWVIVKAYWMKLLRGVGLARS